VRDERKLRKNDRAREILHHHTWHVIRVKTEIDCKTVVFGSAENAILACEARKRLSPFSLTDFTLSPDLWFEY